MTEEIQGTPVYYVVGNGENIIPEGSDEAGVVIAGKTFKSGSILIAMVPNPGMTCMYDYIPNNDIWIRNTALEDHYWGIGLDSRESFFEEISRDRAHELMGLMRNFNPFVIDFLIKEVKDDILTRDDELALWTTQNGK